MNYQSTKRSRPFNCSNERFVWWSIQLYMHSQTELTATESVCLLPNKIFSTANRSWTVGYAFYPLFPLLFCCALSFVSTVILPYCLVGLVVRLLPRERKIPGSNLAYAGIFFGSSHTSDSKIGTPVATLPGVWRYRVSARTGRPSVCILWLGEVESLICNFYLSVAARKIVWADPSLRYTRMLLGGEATNKQTCKHSAFLAFPPTFFP